MKFFLFLLFTTQLMAAPSAQPVVDVYKLAPSSVPSECAALIPAMFPVIGIREGNSQDALRLAKLSHYYSLSVKRLPPKGK